MILPFLLTIIEKWNKEKSAWIALVRQGYSFAISAITKYEIYSGATQNQLTFWNEILEVITVIPFDQVSVDLAVIINRSLKKKRKQIELADLFIAATAVAYNLPFATLNRKHFDRIDSLHIIG